MLTQPFFKLCKWHRESVFLSSKSPLVSVHFSIWFFCHLFSAETSSEHITFEIDMVSLLANSFFFQYLASYRAKWSFMWSDVCVHPCGVSTPLWKQWEWPKNVKLRLDRQTISLNCNPDDITMTNDIKVFSDLTKLPQSQRHKLNLACEICASFNM